MGVEEPPKICISTKHSRQCNDGRTETTLEEIWLAQGEPFNFVLRERKMHTLEWGSFGRIVWSGDQEGHYITPGKQSWRP